MKYHLNKGPIYIGGLDRSGKTTMRGFLASHPNIAIPDVGSNMWTYFYKQYGDLSKPGNLERCLDALFKYKHVRFLKPDRERIRREFAEGQPTYARLFSLFLIHYAEREGKPRWGAQTGLIERYADQLFAAYPNLKVIHMIRDPRDRYEASLARWPKQKGRAGGAVARWRYSTRLAERHLHRYPDRYKIVRFESLVANTEGTLQEVCDFLSEQYDPDMLAMGSARKLRSELLNGRQIEPWENPLSTEYLGSFRKNISQKELAFMQAQIGRKMRAYGYPLDAMNFTPLEKVYFMFIEWPNQWARMAAWLTVEAFQQYLPGLFGRNPGKRMIMDAPLVTSQNMKKG